MALQIIAVNDAAPGACVDVGATYNGTDTITFTSGVVAADVNVTTLTSSGATNLTGDLKVNTNKFVVTGATGNTAVAGDLTVATNKFTVNSYNGDVHLIGNLNTNASMTLLGGITAQQDATVGNLICEDATFQSSVTFTGPVSFGATSHAATAANQVASVNILYDGYSTSTVNPITVTLAQGRLGQIKIIQSETIFTASYIDVHPFQMAGGTFIRLNAHGETVALVWSGTNWRVVFTSGQIL